MQRAIFDCNIFAQALINPLGASGACLQAVYDGQILLYIGAFILREIRELPTKPSAAKLGVTAEKAEELAQMLIVRAEYVEHVPAVFQHPIDEDDSWYVDLAAETGVKVVVSRDRHLTNLTNVAKPWSADFRARFPELRIIGPAEMLDIIRRSRSDE